MPAHVSRPALTWFAGAVLLAAGLFINFHSPASAEPPKRFPGGIAVVDVNKVLLQSKDGKHAYEKLKTMQDDLIGQIQQKQGEIRQLQAALAEGRGSLPEDKIAALEKQIADKTVAVDRATKDADRDVAAARDSTLAALDAAFKPVIEATAAEMELSAVFNKFESGLVYASDSIDITDEVLKRVDKK